MAVKKAISDSKADAVSAVVLIIAVVATAVFWVSNQ